MERPGQRAGQRSPQPGGETLAQLDGGPPAECQDEHLLRTQTPLDPASHRLHQGRCLARARAGKHEQRAAPVRNDPTLRLVGFERRTTQHVTADQPERPRPGAGRRGAPG
jgi:hypothetical protein